RLALIERKVDDATRQTSQSTAAAVQRVQSQLRQLPAAAGMVYAGTVHMGSGNFAGTGGTNGTPRPIHVLLRGDVPQPAAFVEPGAPHVIRGVPAEFALPANHPESARRLGLAEWIVHRDHPLTWRTMANRLWQYHFGRGLVDSPNDFGRMGQTPTHPELLDW